MHNTISRIIAQLHEQYGPLQDGEVADYIPELTNIDPETFGICVFTTDGHEYAIGDTGHPFTIQSISKPFTYGLILDEHGGEKVNARIGVEPSGESFNSISLDTETGRPFNPMINAGAITATGMVDGPDFEARLARIMGCFNGYAGKELQIDEKVYASESATGFRNRAIAHLLRNFEMLDDPVRESVELYFKQCSILVNCRDLAVMGASLANGGVNPVTGERVLKPENVEKVLSVMSTCGMYDYSGEWIFTVGLPAKSGVAGGVLGVLPGQLGVAVFSPRLDARGNSVRGVRVFTELSRRFNLHLFNYPVMRGHVIRRIYTLGQVGSNRQRVKAHHEAIREHGTGTAVIEMQGDIFFSAVERLVRVQTELAPRTETFILDLKRVGLVDHATENLLVKIAAELAESGKSLLVVDPESLIDRSRFDSDNLQVAFFEELNTALERCEEAIIAAHIREPMVGGLVPFYDFELFQSLNSEQLSIIEGLLEMETFPPQSAIVKQGEDADYIYFLAKGNVSVIHNSENGSKQRRKVAAFGPGGCVGDIAVVDGSPRSADVWAEEYTTCYLLSLQALKTLEAEAPEIYLRIMRNILLLNVDRLRRRTEELAALKS